MITRDEFLADKDGLLHSYYLELARGSGWALDNSNFVSVCRDAYRHDGHFNAVNIVPFDIVCRAQLMKNGDRTGRAHAERGDSYSIGSGIEMLKALLRERLSN